MQRAIESVNNNNKKKKKNNNNNNDFTAQDGQVSDVKPRCTNTNLPPVLMICELRAIHSFSKENAPYN